MLIKLLLLLLAITSCYATINSTLNSERIEIMSIFVLKIEDSAALALSNLSTYTDPNNFCECIAYIHERFPGTTVKVIYDQGKNFGSVAKRSFESLRRDNGMAYLKECFAELAPADSRECTPLQTADFLAYEAMRRLDGVRKGFEIRKSLQALIGTKIPLHISQFTDDNFADMKRMKDNRANGRPITEGVKSGLSMTVDSGHPLSKLT